MRLINIFHPYKTYDIFLWRKHHKNGTWNKLIETNKKRALELEWRHVCHTKLNLKHPKTLNEKIQWLEAFTDTSLWSKLSDKYEVRKFVEQRGYKKNLLNLYGIWNDVSEIDYDFLPNSFAIKCTHDCGSTLIIRDKAKEFNKKEINHQLEEHLNKAYGYTSCEPHYISIPRRIMAEELLPQSSDENSIDFSNTIDYKIWCIEGQAQFVLVCYDRHIGKDAIKETYDINPWRSRRDYLSPKYQKQEFREIPEPKGLDYMIKMAEDLAKGFHQVRVDLYNVDGNIYFSEMTFTAACGRMESLSDEVQLMLGQKINLPPKTM
jgi:hypothetical protein